MPWSWKWVVLIASRRGESYKLLGTGTVVAPGRILTARHVVFDEKTGALEPEIVVRLHGGDWSPTVTVEWLSHDPALDVAVLTATLDGEGPSHPLALLSPRTIRFGESWEAQGYPVVLKAKPSETLQKIGGVTRSCEGDEPTLPLDVRPRADVLGGLSGAAVVIGEQIVGVVRGEPRGWNGERLSATPVAAFLHRQAFRDALGLGPQDTLLADDLAKLLAQVMAQLQAVPVVADALAGELGLIAGPGDRAWSVANALVHARTGKAVVRAFAAVDDKLKEDAARAGDRRAIQRLVWQVLPFATDWRPWVLTGRAALARGDKFVDLPLGTMTMAEAVLAGIDCRSCRYETDHREGPAGSALVRKPAATSAPFIDPTGARLAEATVGLLAVTFFGLSPDHPRLRNYDRLRREVNETLQYYCEAVGDNRLPRWLLLDDELLAHLGADTPGDDARTAVAVAVLGKELPHLRVLRMGEGVEDEMNLALHIGGIWRQGI